MLKHLYHKPDTQVIKVESEGIICFSSAHEATEAGGGQLIGSSIPIREYTSTDEDPWDEENGSYRNISMACQFLGGDYS